MDAQTAEKKRELIEAFALLGTISKACQRVQVGRRTHYDWIKADKSYAEEFTNASARFIESLEHEAFRRAVVGVDKPVIYKGELMTRIDETTGQKVPLTIKEYSDTLLIFRLKAESPEKYRDSYELRGPGGSVPIQANILIYLPDNRRGGNGRGKGNGGTAITLPPPTKRGRDADR